MPYLLCIIAAFLISYFRCHLPLIQIASGVAITCIGTTLIDWLYFEDPFQIRRKISSDNKPANLAKLITPAALLIVFAIVICTDNPINNPVVLQNAQFLFLYKIRRALFIDCLVWFIFLIPVPKGFFTLMKYGVNLAGLVVAYGCTNVVVSQLMDLYQQGEHFCRISMVLPSIIK